MEHVWNTLTGKLHFHDLLITLTKQTLLYLELWEEVAPTSAQPAQQPGRLKCGCYCFTASITACLTADVNERGVETGMLKSQSQGLCGEIKQRLYDKP